MEPALIGRGGGIGSARGSLRALYEGVAYSLVFWALGSATVAAWFAEAGFVTPEAEREFVGSSLIKILFVVAACQPVIAIAWAGLIGREDESKVRIGRLGGELLSAVCRGEGIEREMRELAPWFEEGNVDLDHQRVALWVWLGARYAGDATLEREARDRVVRGLIRAAGGGGVPELWPSYQAWFLRTRLTLERFPAVAWAMPLEIPRP